MPEGYTEFQKYKKIFVEECAAECARMASPLTGNEVVVNEELIRRLSFYISKHAGSIKLHTFFQADNLSAITAAIFQDDVHRDFIFCLRDRLCITLSGDFKGLLDCIASFAGNPGTDTPQSGTSLIPATIPDDVWDGFVKSKTDVLEVLTNNSFLVVPIMLYLCYKEIVEKP